MRSTIRRGSTGTDVVRLQELLNKHLRTSPQLVVDGVFGARTEAAALQYQSTARLRTDGIVGSLTWSSLENGWEQDVDGHLSPNSAPGAPWLAVAMREVGQKELKGAPDNPRILQYHAATSLHATDDEVPWCSAFINWCLKQTGIAGTNSAAARSWLHWGRGSVPIPGAISVVKRDTGEHHVAFFISEDRDHISLLGGNQSHQVRVSRFPKSSYVVLGHRWPNHGAK